MRETPSLTAQFPVPCALHLFSPRKNGGLERAGPWPESHGKMTAEWEIERGFQTLCLLACFAGELFSSSPQVRAPSSWSAVPPPADVYSPPAVVSAPTPVRVQSLLTNGLTIHLVEYFTQHLTQRKCP